MPNQYGGTFGGPIRKEKIFFFADYQGQRYIQGIETGFVSVPSMANRNGDFGSASTFTGTVNGPYLAKVLSQRLGQQVTQGESFAQLFPNGVIPRSAWGAAPTRLLQYIPEPNVGVNQFSTGAYKRRINDNKAAGRVDFNSSRFGTSSIYYFNDRYNLDDPYSSGLGGATLPGNGFAYDAASFGIDQTLVFSNIHAFGAKMVNEARFGATGQPYWATQGRGRRHACRSRHSGRRRGHHSRLPVSGRSRRSLLQRLLHRDQSVLARAGQQQLRPVQNSLTRTAGNHTFKFGGRYIWYRVKQAPNLVANGTYSFFASGNQTTGNDYADFLLGLPDFYSQQSSPAFYERAANGDLFAQESYRIHPNLTFNHSGGDALRGPPDL